MSKVTAELIREVREQTGAPMMRAKKVLDELDGDKAKAIELLKKEGFAKMEKRQDRETANGIVVAYAHHTGKVATIAELLCETDFVAKNEIFVALANGIAMQVSAMNPKDNEELLKQEYIKDPTKTIEELIREVTTKTGEVIRLGRFTRIEVGA